MPGFILLDNCLKNNFSEYKNEFLLIEDLKTKNISLQRKTIKKFLNDKIFYQNEKFVILTEGVVFNKKELIKKYQKENFQDTIIEMYQINKEDFFKEFRGTFSGIFINKEKKIKIIYTNQIGDKQVFYYDNSSILIIGSDFNEVLSLIKQNNLKYEIDKISVQQNLALGFVAEDKTYIKEIKKLRPGTYLKIKEKNFEVKTYYEFSKKENKSSLENIINKLDELFLKAVKTQVDKNNEYNYKNIAPLSAGLDSRVVNFALMKLGVDVLNYSYSESDYYDEKIPKQITNDLKREWIFKSLNNGTSLKWIDKILNINFGMALPHGACQVWDILRLINLKEYGLIHTGMLGGVLSGFYLKDKEIKDLSNIGFFENEFIKNKEIFKLNYSYNDNEIMKFLNRAFNGGNMGSPLVFQEMTESYSPFYDLEFLEYVLSIPDKYRKDEKIYDQWIRKKYPDSLNYKVNGKRKDKDKIKIKIKNKNLELGEILPKIKNRIYLKYGLKNRIKGMNPLEKWLFSNSQINEYLNKEYNEKVHKIKDEQLKNIIIDIFESKKAILKLQAIQIIKVLSRFENE